MATSKSKNYNNIFELQKAHPARAEREKVLKQMPNAQIDKLISTCGTNQGKAYLASFKKK